MTLNTGEFLVLAPLNWWDEPRPVTDVHLKNWSILKSLVDRGLVRLYASSALMDLATNGAADTSELPRQGVMEITDKGREALAQARSAK